MAIGWAIVSIESRMLPTWRKIIEPISRIQPLMFMICNTKGMTVATAAALSTPRFQPSSASQVVETTSPALSTNSVDHMRVNTFMSLRNSTTWSSTESATYLSSWPPVEKALMRLDVGVAVDDAPGHHRLRLGERLRVVGDQRHGDREQDAVEHQPDGDGDEQHPVEPAAGEVELDYSCVPCSTMRPLSSTTSRSIAAMVDSRWAMAITVLPSISLQLLLDRRLDLGVERRGRLVEHQDRRVLQQHAGDGDALALAAGELDAALADMGVVARAALGSARSR
jgi:hypothetical protein